MRNYNIILIIALAVLFSSCGALKEAITFSKCEFRMATLENPKLCGVAVHNKSTLNDFSLSDIGKVTRSVLGGKAPLTFTLNIEARNPNPTKAALSKIEWIAFIDDVEIVKGIMDQRVEIAANSGKQIIPLFIQTDLKELLSGKSKNAVVNFGLNLANSSNEPTRVKLKIKPSVQVGNATIVYPGYITLSKEFKSGN